MNMRKGKIVYESFAENNAINIRNIVLEFED